jgi:hypothetical protein
VGEHPISPAVRTSELELRTKTADHQKARNHGVFAPPQAGSLRLAAGLFIALHRKHKKVIKKLQTHDLILFVLSYIIYGDDFCEEMGT